MSMIIALALAAAPAAQPAPTVPADHVQHQQPGQKHDGEKCSCCKDKMAGMHKEHSDGHEHAKGGEQTGHSAN